MSKKEIKINSRHVFHYYWLQIRKYRLRYILGFAVFGVGTILNGGLVPLIYRAIIDTVSSGTDRAVLAPELIKLVFVLAVVSFFANLFYRAGDFLYINSLTRIMRFLADDTFRRIERHSYQFFADEFAGALVAKSRRFIDRFEQLSDQFLMHFWMNGIQLSIILVTLLVLSPPIGGLFLVWCILFVVATIVAVRHKKKLDQAEATEDSKVTARIADVVTNILNVKIFASASREQSEFEDITTGQEKARKKAWNFENIMFATQGTLMMALEVAGMYVAVRLWVAGAISTGTIVLVQVYFGRVFGTLWNLGHAISRFGRHLSEASEMAEIFDRKPSILDPESPLVSSISQGEVVFDKVSFRYGDKSNDVFSDFSLVIRPEERVGLVGPSGAGKSTITKLLLRFVDIQAGSICIDGQDIRDMRQDDLRAGISYVPQDPILFHRSLAENISYGKPDATMEEVMDAARKAHAHEFIEDLPHKYDTLVGERGIKLSGGERQRVAIARAMLKDAPILVLDEATSSLDSESERYIQSALMELMKGRTVIVIAHRLSTIQNMDRIVVLQKGNIVEDSTHKQLLEKRGVYHNLWSHQAGGFIG